MRNLFSVAIICFALLFSGFAYAEESNITLSLSVPLLVLQSEPRVNDVYENGIKVMRVSAGSFLPNKNLAIEFGYRFGGAYDGTPVRADGSKVAGAKSELRLSGMDVSVLFSSPRTESFCYLRGGYFSGKIKEEISYMGERSSISVPVSGPEVAYGCRGGFSLEIFRNSLTAGSTSGWVEGGGIGVLGINFGFGY